jgi:hypothetical protein
MQRMISDVRRIVLVFTSFSIFSLQTLIYMHGARLRSRAAFLNFICGRGAFQNAVVILSRCRDLMGVSVPCCRSTKHSTVTT